MNDTDAITDTERAMLHPCYSHLHEAVERIVAARVAVARADAEERWELALLDLRNRVAERWLPQKYASRVFYEVTMTPNPFRAAVAVPEPEDQA